MKFDVVIMNPPYQGSNDIKRTGDKYQGSSDARSNLLWLGFVNKGIELCKDGGFCAFIHPPKWRKPEDLMWDIITANQVNYLEIHNKKDGKDIFGATTRFDWYVLQKVSPYKKTIIKDELGNIFEQDLKQLSFIPNYNLLDIIKIMALKGEPSLDVMHSAAYHQCSKRTRPVIDDKFIHPCIHGIRDNNDVVIWYSNSCKHGHFGISKVILNDGENVYPIIDMDGKYGMTEHVFAIKVESQEEAENIKKAIESDGFKEIIKATKWSSYSTDYRMFKYFKKDFWKYFV